MFFYNIVRYGSEIGARIFFKINIEGRENIPLNGPVIICANHSSNWDGVLIPITFKKTLSFMAKKEMFKYKIIEFILNRSHVIPVDRTGSDISSLKRALKVLKNNGFLCIFPEGTRVNGYNDQNAKPGIGMIAHKSNVPVLPIYLDCNFKFRTKVNIIIGKPITEHIDTKEKMKSDQYLELSKMILKNIYSLKK